MFPSLENLKFWAGAGLVALVLSSSHLLDGPSEIEAAQATEASRQDALNDALAQAQAERREAEAVAAEQRRVAAIAEAEAKEAKRREADKAHKTAINRAALDAFVQGGMTEECAKLAVTLIAKKAIPAVSITY